MLPVYARSFIGIFVSPPFVSFPFPFTNLCVLIYIIVKSIQFSPNNHDALLFLVRHVYNLMLPVYYILEQT